MSKRSIKPVSPVESSPARMPKPAPMLDLQARFPKPAPMLDLAEIDARHARMAEGDFIVVPTRDEKKKQRKLEKQKPQFQFDVSWFRMGKKVGIAHIRDMLLYIVADAQKPSWIIPEHKQAIEHTVLLFVPGLLPEHIGLDPIPINANMPFPTRPITSSAPAPVVPAIRELFSYGCPTRAPGDQRRLHSVQNTLLSAPLPEHIRHKREAESRKLAAAASSDNASPLIYLLTPNQMLDNDYRLPSYIDPSDTRNIPGLDRTKLQPELAELLDYRPGDTEMGEVPESYNIAGKKSSAVLAGEGKDDEDEWVETPRATAPPPGGLYGMYPVLAIDCEMVVTQIGQELARVSVVDFQSGVNIYDKLVKPAYPVTDYRTQWSGMTEEKLASATATLATVQNDLVTGPEPIFTPNTILLGHSLECDLTAMKIRHALCIDTALIYKHPRGPPYKPGLKWLAQRYLHREIQASTKGHDSEEDAQTCVDLLKMKMANGPEFGSFMDTSESIFERINRYSPDTVRRRTAYCDYGSTKGGPGAKATSVAKCTSDEEVLENMATFVQDHEFVFGRMMELAQFQGWDNKNSSVDETDSNGSTSIPTLLSVSASLNDRIKRLHDSLPSNTALVIMTGHGNPLPMLGMTAKRQKWERLHKTLGSFEQIEKEDRWLTEDDRLLEKYANEAREGMAFFCVKR